MMGVITINEKNITSFSNLWATLISARALFDRMPNKSTDRKRLAIELCISRRYKDETLFWTHYRRATMRLLRNVEFLAECKAYRRNPVHVAEHVVFLGAKTVDAVGEYGLSVLGNEALLYVDPICTDKIVKELEQKDTYKKYEYDPSMRITPVDVSDLLQNELDTTNEPEQAA